MGLRPVEIVQHLADIVAGVDFELYSHDSYGEAALDSASQAVDMRWELTMGQNSADDARGIDARIDSFACYDMMLIIKPDLTAAVSF